MVGVGGGTSSRGRGGIPSVKWGVGGVLLLGHTGTPILEPGYGSVVVTPVPEVYHHRSHHHHHPLGLTTPAVPNVCSWVRPPGARDYHHRG